MELGRTGRAPRGGAREGARGPGRAGRGRARRGGQASTALDTVLFYYGKGEKATSAQQATSKIYPKNNSVQNRSASELKKTFTGV